MQIESSGGRHLGPVQVRQNKNENSSLGAVDVVLTERDALGIIL